MMPAWVNEPAQPNEYSHYEGEDAQSFRRDSRGGERGRDQRSPRGPRPAGGGKPGGPRRDDRRDPRGRPERGRSDHPPERREPREAPVPLPQVDVRFLPHAGAFEGVIAQIKNGSVAYSVFALARLFLEKPERYAVRLTVAEGATLHQLGEHGAVAVDRRILENGAFAATRDDFYSTEETQTEGVKGNFTNVARDRISGTLLGPTNHHNYQPQLRGLYEQRYSRRMSFPDFQRQIEIVSDPAVVEQWKEQARTVTTYTAKNSEPPLTFNTLAEVEHHFRQTHLPTLLRSGTERTISGVASRALADRALGRVIEEAWAAEVRSPSKMMQELAGGLRQGELQIFRHRRGMLYVSPLRTRPFGHERTGVSPSVNAILEKLAEAPGTNRKGLAHQLTKPDADEAEQERVKRTLISDLHWLISEGYVIEFNDGTLDLPRTKAPVAGSQQAAAEGRRGTNRVQASRGETQSTKVEPASSGAQPESTEVQGETIGVQSEATDVQPQTSDAQSEAFATEPQAISAETQSADVQSESSNVQSDAADERSEATNVQFNAVGVQPEASRVEEVLGAAPSSDVAPEVTLQSSPASAELPEEKSEISDDRPHAPEAAR